MATYKTPLQQQSRPEGLVCSMTTALTPVDLKAPDHVRPPNDLSNTLPSRLATAEVQQVLAAEAKKVGSANEDTLLIPRPPDLMGRLACSHCDCDSVLLLIRDSAVLNRLSNSCGPVASTEGEQRNRRWTLGALNKARKRINASWRPTRQSLSTALERSRHRSDQKSFRTVPGNSGAPKRVASPGSKRLKDRSMGSSTTRPEWATSSHLAAFKMLPYYYYYYHYHYSYFKNLLGPLAQSRMPGNYCSCYYGCSEASAEGCKMAVWCIWQRCW